MDLCDPQLSDFQLRLSFTWSTTIELRRLRRRRRVARRLPPAFPGHTLSIRGRTGDPGLCASVHIVPTMAPIGSAVHSQRSAGQSKLADVWFEDLNGSLKTWVDRQKEINGQVN